MIDQDSGIVTMLLIAALAGLVLLSLEALMLDINFEEPRRLLVAQSMLANGEYVVPHILGERYLSKPPGYNWFVALFALPFGAANKLAGRGVAIFSWICTGGLLFFVTRRLDEYLTRAWIVLAGLFPLTVFIEKAALAELDLFFSLILLGGVCLWFELAELGRENWAWLVSHLFLVLAVLTKGPVAYLYFYIPIFCLVFMTESDLAPTGLLGGFLIAHLCLAGWLGAVFNRISPTQFFSHVFTESVGRGSGIEFTVYLKQLIFYPLRGLLAFLPWALVFAVLFFRDLRETLFGAISRTDLFKLGLAGLAPGVVFWLHPADRVRYLLPVFPYLALASGAVFFAARRRLREKFFKRAGIFLGCVLVLLVGSPWLLSEPQGLLSFNQLLAGGLILAGCGLYLIFQSARNCGTTSRMLTVFVIFMLAVKIGYLFLYLPQDEPEYFQTARTVEAVAAQLHQRNIKNITYTSDNYLQLPYYLLKENIKVNKRTDRTRPEGWLLSPEHNAETDTPIVSFKLPAGPKFSVYHRAPDAGQKNS